MDNISITKLRDEFANTHKQAEELVTKVAGENRDLTADEKTENEKRFARLDQIKHVLDEQKRVAEYAFSAEDPSKRDAAHVQLPSEPAGKPNVTVRDRFDLKGYDRQSFRNDINEWSRTGRVSGQLAAFNKQFATITGSTDNAILMPSDVASPIAPSAMNTFRQALVVCGLDPLRTPSTRDLKLPIFTASAGAAVNPTSTTELEQEPALTESVDLQIVTYHSGDTWLENRELMAVDFDLMTAVLPALKYSKELAFESAIVTAIQDASVSTVATQTVSGVTYGNMVSLNRALPKRYQTQKVIVVSTSVYTALENLTTTTGYPILNALDPQNTTLKFFNGTPVVYSDYFSGFGANNIVGCVFSWVGARLRDAGDGDVVQRFTQTPNRQGQTGVDLYGYHAFGFSASAVVNLVCPAS